MPFVDTLTSELFVLGFAGLSVAYMVVRAYLQSRHSARAIGAFKSAIAPFAVFGAFMVISGLWGQFTWPLPGSYNILFYDMYALAGLVFIAMAWSIRSGADLQNVGFFSFMLGFVSIYYGYIGYTLGMTTSPIGLLALYSLFGIAGVLGCPLTLMLDRIRSGARVSVDSRWVALLAIFLIVLVLGSLLAIYIAAAAIPAHLANPP